jgi:hypothetical protein
MVRSIEALVGRHHLRPGETIEHEATESTLTEHSLVATCERNTTELQPGRCPRLLRSKSAKPRSTPIATSPHP